MIDDDGYDGIRSHGVDPDWNPFSTPRDDDPDDIGWDDGSETPHANPSRMSRKGVAVLPAGPRGRAGVPFVLKNLL